MRINTGVALAVFGFVLGATLCIARQDDEQASQVDAEADGRPDGDGEDADFEADIEEAEHGDGHSRRSPTDDKDGSDQDGDDDGHDDPDDTDDTADLDDTDSNGSDDGDDDSYATRLRNAGSDPDHHDHLKKPRNDGSDRDHHDHLKERRNTMGSLVKLDMHKHPYAKCLDGSPGGYFLLHGDPSEFVIHLAGGGECVTKFHCLARAGSALGTSTMMPPKLDFDAPGSLTDTDEKRNKRLAGATMVRVHYCTGDLYSGGITKPSDDTFGLWFSGYGIVKAVLEDLMEKHHIGKAKLVVWSGDSAGGIGSVLSLDHVSDTLKAAGSKAEVVGAPLAGFYFLNSHPYDGFGAVPYMGFDNASIKLYTELWNSTLPEHCTKEYIGREWLCLFSNFSAPTLKTDIMFFTAQTDMFVLPLHNGVPGSPPFNFLAMDSFVRDWARGMRNLISSVVRPGVSAFNPACWTHTYFEGVHVHDLKYQDAFAQFLESPHERRNMLLQDHCKGVSCNDDCAAVLWWSEHLFKAPF